MELSSFFANATNKTSQNYKIINTVCCFGSRQYCRSEHKLNDSSDWLIRLLVNVQYQQIKKSIINNNTFCKNHIIKLLIRKYQFLKYTFYHRNRHRKIRDQIKFKTSTRLTFSSKKFNHLKSIKVKFKKSSRPTLYKRES